MLTIITLPGSFVTEITATMGTLFTDLGSYITLIIGVVLGILVIRAVISMIR